MYSERLKEFKTNKQKQEYTPRLDISNHSSRSKNSFKETFIDHRNHTPTNTNTHRPKTAQNQQNGTNKMKLILNTLVQPENLLNTQLFTQSLLKQNSSSKKEQSTTPNKNNSGQKNTYQSKFQFQLNKTPKNGESFLKSSMLQPSTYRESAKHQDPQTNLYYMFQNKPSQPTLKTTSTNSQSKMLTLSQLARQYQSRKSNNTTPQRNNLKTPTNNNYLEQFQQLKQKLDNSVNQRSPSQKTEKSVNSQFIKNLTQQLAKQTNTTTQLSTNQTQHSLSSDETVQQSSIKLLLQKELLWNQMSIDQISIGQLANLCSSLQKTLRDLSDRSISEYLYKLDPQTVEAYLLESQTVLIITLEYIKINKPIDLNLKNLIQYVASNNLQMIQIINRQISNDLLKQRIELRNSQTKKNSSRGGKQSAHKNNQDHVLSIQLNIIKSILELMQLKRIDDTSRPESYASLGFNQNNLDLYLIQQRRILSQIERDLPKDSIESAETLFQIDPPAKITLPQKPSKPYTLVLDLDETLVHYQEFPNGGGQFLVRPYAEDFLEILSKHYEIVIFTAALPDYANFIIDIIDKTNVVSARLYRDNCMCKDNIYIKDISILGRNISKIIIVDNMPENFQLQPENGIYIQSWMGDQKDKALKDLQPLLEQIAIKKVRDVRVALNQFREQMIEKVQLGIKNPYQNLQLN